MLKTIEEEVLFKQITHKKIKIKALQFNVCLCGNLQVEETSLTHAYQSLTRLGIIETYR